MAEKWWWWWNICWLTPLLETLGAVKELLFLLSQLFLLAWSLFYIPIIKRTKWLTYHLFSSRLWKLFALVQLTKFKIITSKKKKKGWAERCQNQCKMSDLQSPCMLLTLQAMTVSCPGLTATLAGSSCQCWLGVTRGRQHNNNNKYTIVNGGLVSDLTLTLVTLAKLRNCHLAVIMSAF